MLRKIKLYGKLAKFIGHRVLEADVATAAEAVRFLVANWPELEAHMNDQHYRVSIGTYDIDLEELHHPAGAAPISFVPVVAGAGATRADPCWDCLNRGGIYPWIWICCSGSGNCHDLPRLLPDSQQSALFWHQLGAGLLS
jgi:hypothetical protein